MDDGLIDEAAMSLSSVLVKPKINNSDSALFSTLLVQLF
jgi:hypothetical protein